MSLDGSPAEQLFSYAVATLLVFLRTLRKLLRPTCFPAERLICSNFARSSGRLTLRN